MWKYIKPYLHFAILAALFMVGEVLADLAQPTLMSQVVDEGVLGINNGGVSDLGLIMRVGGLMIVVVLLGGLSGSLNNIFVNFTGQNIGNLIRKDTFKSIMGFSFPQIDKFGTGSLITRTTNDITQVSNFISNVFVRGMIRTGFLTFGSIYCMFRLNATFGWMVLGATPILIAVMLICLWKANPLFPVLQAQLDSVNEILQEDISGIRIIKACVREAYEKLRFGKANDAMVHTQLLTLIIFAFMTPVMNIMMNLVVVLILLVGAHQTSYGLMTPGVIMAAITYTTQLLNGINGMIMLFQNISKGIASWARVKDILDTDAELTDGEFTGAPPETGTVEFKNVSFSFPGTEREVLHDFSLKIHPGETLAIMGATGSGKSALVNLIPRFYDVTAGQILVDGIDVRQYRIEDLRSRISIALQKTQLFSLPISENIRWGAPDADADQIQQAIQTAQATAFVSELSGGQDAVLAERGNSLSGGQKQRLSIARAVVKPAEILIFDDSTSALDLKTEADLYHALAQRAAGTTRIMIAQRIASVRHADRIAVISDGVLAACGTHEELLANSQIYQDIYNSQQGKEDELDG